MVNKSYARNICALRDRQNKKKARFAGFLYAAYFTYFLLPICTQVVPRAFRFTLYFLISVYGLYISIDQNKQIYRSTFLFLISVCAFIVVFYYGKWKGTSGFSEYFFTVFFFWLPLLFFKEVSELPLHIKKTVKSLFWGYIFITMITTAIGNIQFPESSRYLASYTPLASVYRSHNIGDYHFVYGSVILVPYILYEIKNAQRGKIFFVLVLGATFSLVVITQYAIAIIICITEIACIFILRAKNKVTMILKCLLIVSVVYLIKDSISSWLLSLKKVFEEAQMKSLADRCTMLAKYFMGEGTTGDMAIRENLYWLSWAAFCDSPLLGKLTGLSTTIGGHSELLDILGATGLLGFSLFLYCVSYYIRKVIMYIAREDTIYVTASFIGLMVLFSVNTGLFPAVGMMAFMAAPLVLQGKSNRLRVHT